ncbi:MAG: DUF3575 domain-containing protein [Natronospirillum sp.]|uniref:DUF3575 domain-containing protein n=1 Tax=Natronospirillum sp. TaxID=2812955 RepID=UPI0025FD94BF|nr:DUF3575 domain-containing protein [Natronospirillum sp.]MCH8551769.1 DUF3575 domain-containing protein [Natronospirillum sp.]
MSALLVLVLSLSLSLTAAAGAFRHDLSTDLVGWGFLNPNISYDNRISNHFSLGADLSFNAKDLSDGIVLSPHLRYYPTGAFREGYLAQVGGYLPTEGDLLLEGGLGYSVWVDRMHLTPVGLVRHDLSWQIRLEIGYGWY